MSAWATPAQRNGAKPPLVSKNLLYLLSIYNSNDAPQTHRVTRNKRANKAEMLRNPESSIVLLQGTGAGRDLKKKGLSSNHPSHFSGE